MIHALVFHVFRPAAHWRVFNLFRDSVFAGASLYTGFLSLSTRTFNSWDEPLDKATAETQVLSFCRFWGVSPDPWVWDKKPSEYTSKNDFFTRTYAKEHAPPVHPDADVVVSPADAVVTWYPSVQEMPMGGAAITLKADTFGGLSDVGIPDAHLYQGEGANDLHPCCFLYLAPADYHCFHTPIGGRVLHCKMFGGLWSGTVKYDMWSKVNVLTEYRRVVLVIEDERGRRVCMVIVGGITVDSIRMDIPCEASDAGGSSGSPPEPQGQLAEGLRQRKGGAASTTPCESNTVVAKGQKVGCFARGGSLIALFFGGRLTLQEDIQEAVKATSPGADFKLVHGAGLGRWG